MIVLVEQVKNIFCRNKKFHQKRKYAREIYRVVENVSKLGRPGVVS
jgi:hypothetical protein